MTAGQAFGQVLALVMIIAYTGLLVAFLVVTIRGPREHQQRRPLPAAPRPPPPTAAPAPTPPACRCVSCLARAVAVEQGLPEPLSRRAALLLLGAYQQPPEA